MGSTGASRAIGVFDSGVGGLTVLKELMRELPSEDFIYLGDSARAPFGPKGQETVRRYARESAVFFHERGIKMLVVACNTASALALDVFDQICGCPVIGVVEPAVRAALEASSVTRVGVIGTEATISSSVYDRSLRSLRPDLQVFSKACPLFVPLVEQGMLSGEIVEKVCEMYLGEMRDCRLDAIILGCTHYPLLKTLIGAYLPSHVSVVECSLVVASEAHEKLEEAGMLKTAAQGSCSWFVTDDVMRFNRLAELFMGRRGISAVQVNLKEETGL